MEHMGIVDTLKKRDPQMFQDINLSTINNWIDHTGYKPKWNERTLECVRHGSTQSETYSIVIRWIIQK